MFVDDHLVRVNAFRAVVMQVERFTIKLNSLAGSHLVFHETVGP